MDNKKHSISHLPSTNVSCSDVEQTFQPIGLGSTLHGGGNTLCVDVCNRQRIEYIDALRGFAIILVVVQHMSGLCLRSVDSYASMIAQFHMPLFFFISGFVFYKNQIWDNAAIIIFLKKKIPVYILTPTVFMLLYIYIYKRSLIGVLYDGVRYGFWFTYILFLFSCFYICIKCVSQSLKINSKGCDIMLLIWGVVCYAITLIGDVMREYGSGVPYILLTFHWKHFIFFAAGTIIKKRYTHFQQLLNTKYFLLLFIVAFYFLSNIFDIIIYGYHGIIDIVIVMTRSFCGLFIVFIFFYKYSSSFTKERWLGRTLQYVGQRTLDVYLLHWFFLPFGLVQVFPFFSEKGFPMLEIFVSMFLSMLVIVLCIITSNVYRLSPWIEQNMFGIKKKKK